MNRGTEEGRVPLPGWATLLVPCWLLLVGLPLFARGRAGISPAGMGFLRRGERGALATAAIGLHAGGHVVVTRRGLLQRGKALMGTWAEPLAAAVYAAIPAPARLRALPARPRVRTAVAALVRELAAAGLIPGRVRWLVARGVLVAAAVLAAVRVLDPDLVAGQRPGYAVALVVAIVAWWVPRRTVVGYRTLHKLRREHAAGLEPPAAGSCDPASPAAAATAYALAGVVPPGMAAALARAPVGRSPDDQPTAGGYDSGPGIMP